MSPSGSEKSRPSPPLPAAPDRARQDVLVAELNHRVRNILALIRAVVRLSGGAATSVEGYARALEDRIDALARAHDRITAKGWEPTSFEALARDEARPFLGAAGELVSLRGPDVLLEPRAATAITLVLHEMLTNSAKHGALRDGGRVEIATELDVLGRFVIAWTERGGPRVRPPQRHGFGRTVIERVIPHDLGGSAELFFDVGGVRARFVVPAGLVRPPPALPASTDAAAAEAAPPREGLPRDVLLVEDSVIVALDTQEILLRAGVASVRLAASVAQALQAITERTPDFALLDVDLGAETSFPVAERLSELGVPFAFATGYGEPIAFPPRFALTARLDKPYGEAALRSALRRPR